MTTATPAATPTATPTAAGLAPTSALDSHWRAQEGTAGSTVVDPNTGAPIATYRNATREDVDAAVARAAEAYRTWRLTTPAERSELLLRLADRVEEHADELARLESLNVGKPLASARAEIPATVDGIRYMAGAARVSSTVAAGEYVSGNTSYIRREPVGVVGLITPWNYPLLEAAWKLAPALGAGNTVVLKPSELTPLTTIRLFELAAEVFPDGVANLVLGDGTTGRAIVENPKVRLVSLTGDVSTGKAVATAAAAHLSRVHLELGGKAPVVVLDDVAVAATARALVQAGFVNSGQDCTAACRVLVHAAVHDEFVEAYVNEAAKLVVGDPGDPGTHLGPVVSSRQLERVEGFVRRAEAAGATIRAGGQAPARDGWFFEPTVVTGVSQDDEIVQREVFGPVVTIQKGGSDDELLELANDVDYGLSASVWTGSLARSARFTRDLRFGTVWVNEHLTTVAEMPFGGFGESGYGKELSTQAIDEYSQLKHVMINPAPEG